MIWRDSAATIGVIRSTWAITMAGGVNSRPKLPNGPARDNSRVHDQAGHYWRQAHGGVEQDHQCTAAGKAPDRHAGTQERAQQGRNERRRHTDLEGQGDDGDQLGVKRQRQRQRIRKTCENPGHREAAVKNRSNSVRVRYRSG